MLNSLKLYTVHSKQGSDHTRDKPIFLREGFNIFAFLFTLPWALYQRLWVYALYIFLSYLAVVLAMRAGLLDEVSSSIIQLGIQVMVGFTANDALRVRMQKKGYIFQNITSGDSLLRAEQRYFDRVVAHG